MLFSFGRSASETTQYYPLLFNRVCLAYDRSCNWKSVVSNRADDVHEFCTTMNSPLETGRR